VKNAQRSLLVLLVGSLAFLASLYLPWEWNATTGPCNPRSPFSCAASSFEGWSVGGAAVAALSAAALAICVVAALRWPSRWPRLPLARLALLTAYLALAGWAASLSGRNYETAIGGHVRFAYGVYLGLAAVAVCLGAAAVLRRDEILRRPSVARATGIALAVSMLLAFLLPWHRVSVLNHTVAYLGISSSAAVISAAVICLAMSWWGTDGRVQLLAAAAVAVLTAAQLTAALNITPVPFPDSVQYGAWVGLGVSLALLVFSARDLKSLATRRRPPREVAVVFAPAALLLVALFLPWQSSCWPTGDSSVPRIYAGVCSSGDGWSTFPGAIAGALVLGLLSLLLLRRSGVPTLRIAVAIGLLVATVGFTIEAPFPDVQITYGAFVGFAAAGILLVAAARLRPRWPSGRRPLVRLIPALVCVALLAVVVVPWWHVLPGVPVYRLAGPTWFTVAIALLALNLTASWLRRIVDPAARRELVVQTSVALVIASLYASVERDIHSGIVVGLCLILLALAWNEERDRISTGED
jgi:hypothetical protein